MTSGDVCITRTVRLYCPGAMNISIFAVSAGAMKNPIGIEDAAKTVLLKQSRQPTLFKNLF
jgi:hypothetical protein